MSEFAWVIERGDSPTSSPLYLSGVSANPLEQHWSSDHLDAIRFCREVDARKVENMCMGAHRVCEHGWY